MARLKTILTRCSEAPTALFCLVAGLVLTLNLPAPVFVRGALGYVMRLPSEGPDAPWNDAETPEGETSSDELGILTPARRRPSRLSARDGLRAARHCSSWAVLAASPPFSAFPSWFDTGARRTGHFLAEGRTLRLWFQSQTC
jgi:hypothetical protein